MRPSLGRLTAKAKPASAALLLLATLLATAYINCTNVKLAEASPEHYRTVHGILEYDCYFAYPWLKKSITVGFSKWGEIIDDETLIGIRYGGLGGERDPFANSRVELVEYSEGWWFNASYRTYTYGPRRVWAFALYSDLRSYGGEWINSSAGYNIQPYGGRKTSGRAVSEAIETVYDGPRRTVSILRTHIYDEPVPGIIYPVADLETTIVFVKVYKMVLIFDDITLRVPVVELGKRSVEITFARQSKWQLGPWPDFRCYVHFYRGLPTCYNASWHTYGGAAGGFPSDAERPRFLGDPAYSPWHGYYDVAQIIDRDMDFVGFAAFWPNATEVAVNATDYWFRNLPSGVKWVDSPSEPEVPFIKAQWRYLMNYTNEAWQHFRHVTVYGITDYVQARDTGIGPAYGNLLEPEVVFLLDTVFNPWPTIPNAFTSAKATGRTDIHMTCWNWILLGVGSRVVDSIGAVELVHALDSANITTGRGLFDMMDYINSPNSSYAFMRYGPGYTRPNYYIKVVGEEVGERACLMPEEPVTGLPIAGTNITVVGDPYVNLGTEYANDFVPAFALSPPPLIHCWTEVYALTCWEHNRYPGHKPGAHEGVGVVSTCRDLNHVAMLVVWGWTADDTTHLCHLINQHIMDRGPYDMQRMPNGTLSVIIKITYDTPPKYEIAEILGAISEFKPYSE